TRSKRDWSSDVCSSDLWSCRPADSSIGLESVLLLPLHDSRLGLNAVAAVNASADLALDLADRGTIRLPVSRVDSVALVLGVVEEIGRASCRERGRRERG